MKELYKEIKETNLGLFFLPDLSLSGPTKFVYLWLLVFTFSMVRDDGLALSRLSPFETNKMKDDIAKIFGKNGLRITIHSNLKVVDYLGVILDLMTGLHQASLCPC